MTFDSAKKEENSGIYFDQLENSNSREAAQLHHHQYNFQIQT